MVGPFTVVRIDGPAWGSSTPLIDVEDKMGRRNCGIYLSRFKAHEALTGRIPTTAIPDAYWRGPSAPHSFRVGDMVVPTQKVLASATVVGATLRTLKLPLRVVYTMVSSNAITVVDAAGRKLRGYSADHFRPHDQFPVVRGLSYDSTFQEFAKGVLMAYSKLPPVKPKSAVAKFFFLAVLEGNQPKPAVKPRLFETRERAEKVARIMAAKHPGNHFAVMEAVSSSYVPNVEPVTTSI